MRIRPLLMPVVFIVVLGAVVPARLSFAQAITDLSYELATLSEPELLVDWRAAGLGTRAGVRVTTVGNTRTYTHSSLGLDNGEAFLMDVVLSAEWRVPRSQLHYCQHGMGTSLVAASL